MCSCGSTTRSGFKFRRTHYNTGVIYGVPIWVPGFVVCMTCCNDLNCGMNPVIVEWLMGHGIGIAMHYLADNIKQEYKKFEQAVSLS